MKHVRIFGAEIGRSVGLLLCCATLIEAVLCGSTLGPASPTSVVQEYCKLDQEGARQSSQDPDNERIFAPLAKGGTREPSAHAHTQFWRPE
jgi:hypothetical protein